MLHGIWSGDWDPGIRGPGGLGSGDPGTGIWMSGDWDLGIRDWDEGIWRLARRPDLPDPGYIRRFWGLRGQILDTFVKYEGWGGGPGAEVIGVARGFVMRLPPLNT